MWNLWCVCVCSGWSASSSRREPAGVFLRWAMKMCLVPGLLCPVTWVNTHYSLFPQDPCVNQPPSSFFLPPLPLHIHQPPLLSFPPPISTHSHPSADTFLVTHLPHPSGLSLHSRELPSPPPAPPPTSPWCPVIGTRIRGSGKKGETARFLRVTLHRTQTGI